MLDFYTQKLDELFVEKSKKNPNYSLRALSRDLHIDPGDLNRIMNNKKKVTPSIAYKIGLLLKLEEKEFLNFLRPALN